MTEANHGEWKGLVRTWRGACPLALGITLGAVAGAALWWPNPTRADAGTFCERAECTKGGPLTLQRTTVVGVVRDSIDLEPVVSARVVVSLDGVRVGEALSDRYGAFAVAGVAAGPVNVEIRRLGYEMWTVRYEGLPANPLRVLLHPAPLAIEGVVARVDGSPSDPLAVSPGSFVIDRELVRAQPVVLETDVLRAATVSPAASSTSDFAAIPYIRGGASEGTPVLLDGVRLFNPFHALGMMSALNGQAVRQVRLITGSEGEGQAVGSLSGAFDVVTRDGARDRFRASGSLGMTSVRLATEGPIGPSTSYLVDGRQSHIHWITGGRVPFSFDDVHAKVTRDLGGVGRLSLTGYLSHERMNASREAFIGDGAVDSIRWNWGNAAVAAHYRDRLGSSGTVDVNVGHSRFNGGFAEIGGGRFNSTPVATVDYRGTMQETRADARTAHALGRARVEGGLQAIRSRGDHESAGKDGEFFNQFSAEGARTRIAGYANVSAPLRWGVSGRVGLRVDRFLGLETTLAPFAGVAYAGPWWRAWLSGSQSHQALSSVRNEETISASYWALDLLLPVDRAPVPKSTDLVGGWEGTVGAWRLRFEAYARRMDNLRLFPLKRDAAESVNFGRPASQELASGTARGIELSWSWIRTGRGSVVGSYRWGSAKRTVEGVRYTPRFHRDHELELSTGLERGSSLWSLRFSGRTGQPLTAFTTILPYVGVKWPDSSLNVIDDHAIVLAGEYNAARLPMYVRIDLGWRTSREVSWFGGGTLEPFVSIANLFSLPNVVGSVADYDDGKVEIFHMPQMPMFPFFGMEFRF